MANDSFKVVKYSVFRNWRERLITSFLIFLGFALIGFFAVWWFRISNVAHNFSGPWHAIDFLLFFLLTFIVWYQIINEMLAWELALFMKRPKPPKPQEGLKVALCTAFVPGKEPYDMLEQTLGAMVAVNYPHDTWLLDEGDDSYCKELCQRYGARHFSRKGKPEYNTESGKYRMKTKAGNFNSWFDSHSKDYDIVAQHDVDFRPKKEFLEKTLGYFRDPEIAFVGTPQVYNNINESWIARGAAEQAYGFYGTTQKGLFGHDMQLFIGANHIIRVKTHDAILGYSGHIVEDHLTGMRIYSKRFKSVYVPKVLLLGEGPATWPAYFSQQMRWAFGLMDILFRHSPKLFLKMRLKHALHYFLLQHYYFFGISQSIGILLMSLYFFFGIHSTIMDLNQLLIFYPSLVIMQILIFLWLQRFYVRPKTESGFHFFGKLLSIAAWPIYFVAFLSAVVGKKLPYEVTPKGAAAQREGVPPRVSLFLTHAIFGTITALGIFIAFKTGRTAPLIVFWAITNTLFMYFFVSLAVFEKIAFKIKSFSFGGRFLVLMKYILNNFL